MTAREELDILLESYGDIFTPIGAANPSFLAREEAKRQALMCWHTRHTPPPPTVEAIHNKLLRIGKDTDSGWLISRADMIAQQFYALWSPTPVWCLPECPRPWHWDVEKGNWMRGKLTHCFAQITFCDSCGSARPSHA